MALSLLLRITTFHLDQAQLIISYLLLQLLESILLTAIEDSFRENRINTGRREHQGPTFVRRVTFDLTSPGTTSPSEPINLHGSTPRKKIIIMPRPTVARKRDRTPHLSILWRVREEHRPTYFIETPSGALRESWIDPNNFDNGPRKARRLSYAASPASAAGAASTTVAAAAAAAATASSLKLSNDMTVLDKLQMGLRKDKVDLNAVVMPKPSATADSNSEETMVDEEEEEEEEEEDDDDDEGEEDHEEGEQPRSKKKKQPARYPSIRDVQNTVDQSVGTKEFSYLPEHLQDVLAKGTADPMVHHDIISKTAVPTAYKNLRVHYRNELPYV